MLMRVHHAKTNEDIDLVVEAVLAWHYIESMRCQIVIGIGGAMVPVKESQEEIASLYEGAVRDLWKKKWKTQSDLKGSKHQT